MSENIIKEIKNIILKIYNDYYKSNVNRLNELHLLLESDKVDDATKEYYRKIPIFGVSDRSSKFIKLFYEYYDNNTDLNEKYIEIMKYIKKKYYKEEEYIVIQKTPNLRIHFPNCSNIGSLDTDPNKNIIGLHNDRMFGHPHSEMNLIIALTNMFDSNSIYVETEEGNKFEPIKIKENNIGFYYLNKLRHYNKINNTKKTRVSFDIRIIPFSKYEEKTRHNYSATTNTKFRLNHYYIKI